MDTLLFYFSVFFIVFVIQKIALATRKTNHKIISNILIIVSLMILTCLFGFRYYVGTDYKSYYELLTHYRYSNNILSSASIEIGNRLLIYLSFMFTNKYLAFFLYGFVTMLPLYLANKEYDYKYLPLSIFIYNCTLLPFAFNGMRQAVAMSLLLLSFVYLKNNKKRKSIITYILAFMFHTSAIIMLPYFIVLFIQNEKKEQTINKYFFLGTIVVSLLMVFGIERLLSLGIFDKYAYFLRTFDVEVISFKNLIHFMPAIIMIGISTFTDEFNSYKQLYLSGIPIYVVATAGRFLTRISLYFNIFQILLIPAIIGSIKKRESRIFVSIAYIAYLIVYFYIQFYVYGRHEIIPYISWYYL
jgi:hypothetical protein